MMHPDDHFPDHPDDPYPDDQGPGRNQQRTLLQETAGVLAVLRAVQFAESGTGNIQACLTFQITDEASPDNGRITCYFGTFTDASIDFTVEALRNCGWQGDDLAEIPALAEADQLAEVVSLKIVNETYQGKTTSKVKFVNKPGTGGKAGVRLERELDASDLSRFSMAMRTKVRAAGRDRDKRGGQRPAAQPRSQPPRGNGRAPASHAHDPNIPPPGDADKDW